ncbi:Cna B-type domain-containing protein, partial [Vagococcus fluvialis]
MKRWIKMKKIIILLLGILFIVTPSISYASMILDELKIEGVRIDKNLKDDPNVHLDHLNTLSSRLYTIIDNNGNYYFCLQEHRAYPSGPSGVEYELDTTSEFAGSVVWLIEHFYSDYDGEKSKLNSYVNENFERKYSATQIAVWYFTNSDRFETPEKMKIINENKIIKELVESAEMHKDDSIKNYKELIEELDSQSVTLSEIKPIGEAGNYYLFETSVEKSMTNTFKITNEQISIELLTDNNTKTQDITDESIIEISNGNLINFQVPQKIINDNKDNGTLLLRAGADIESINKYYLMFTPVSANVQNIATRNKLKKELLDFRMISTKDVTRVTVIKDWDDDEDRDGFRPQNISVQLNSNGKPIGSPVVLQSENNWSYVWNNLPKNNDTGKEIIYSVTEIDKVSGYDSIIKENNDHYFVISNIHKPELIDISGEKKWVEPSGQNNIRPKTIRIHLLANGKKIDYVDVDESSNWKYSFKDLFKYENKEEILYTIEEEKVPGYQTEINGYNITNTYLNTKTSVTVTKAWNDSEDQDGIRPTSIQVQLYADGKAKGDPVTLTEANTWTHTWQELDE